MKKSKLITMIGTGVTVLAVNLYGAYYALKPHNEPVAPAPMFNFESSFKPLRELLTGIDTVSEKNSEKYRVFTDSAKDFNDFSARNKGLNDKQDSQSEYNNKK